MFAFKMNLVWNIIPMLPDICYLQTKPMIQYDSKKRCLICPFNLYIINFQINICFNVMISNNISLVLIWFRVYLLKSNQAFNLCISLVCSETKNSCIINKDDEVKFRWYLTNVFNLYNLIPKAEPCGTLQVILRATELQRLILTN